MATATLSETQGERDPRWATVAHDERPGRIEHFSAWAFTPL